ncbi:MAG: hypothetical protein ABSA97_12990 [Verrucomicrobiia bacterium]
MSGARQTIKNQRTGSIIVQAAGNGINITVGSPWLTLIPVQRRLKETPITGEVQLLARLEQSQTKE